MSRAACGKPAAVGRVGPVVNEPFEIDLHSEFLRADLFLSMGRPDEAARILEPVVELTVTCPEDCMGDITGDLSSRRAQVAGTDVQMGGQTLVKAQAPLAELMGYQNRLNALTSGQGRYTLSLSHYEAVPPNVQQLLTSQHKVANIEE